MKVIVVANPKGGVGKSTLSTNVAAWLAHQGRRVALGDLDRQQSARSWLSLRPASLPRIERWDVDPAEPLRTPKGVDVVVLDTPAGLHDKALGAVLKVADQVIVPVQPSPFDIQATHAFFLELQSRKRIAKLDVAVVGMRVKEGTLAAEQLRQYLKGSPFEAVAALRDTQNYIQLAAHGLSLWDIAPSRVERDLLQWTPVLEFLVA